MCACGGAWNTPWGRCPGPCPLPRTKPLPGRVATLRHAKTRRNNAAPGLGGMARRLCVPAGSMGHGMAAGAPMITRHAVNGLVTTWPMMMIRQLLDSLLVDQHLGNDVCCLDRGGRARGDRHAAARHGVQGRGQIAGERGGLAGCRAAARRVAQRAAWTGAVCDEPCG